MIKELFIAIRKEIPADQLKTILENVLNLNETDSNGETVLHVAIKYNHVEAVKLLLDKGVNLKIANNEGETPTILAAQRNLEILNLLLSQKSISQKGDAISAFEINKKDNKGNTALCYIFHKTVAAAKISAAAKTLLMHGADPNIANAKGVLPLICAVDLPEVLNELLIGGANPFIHDNNGYSPLNVAMAAGNFKSVELLKEFSKRFMEKMKDDVAINEEILFGKRCVKVKEAGHVLGLSSKIKVKRGANVVEIETEGNFPQLSVKILNELLAAYQRENKLSNELQADFKEITEAFILCDKHLKYEDEKTFKELLERYKPSINDKNGKIVAISTGWDRHAIGIGLRKGKAFVCNRGEKGDVNSVYGHTFNAIFGIIDDDFIDDQFIRDVHKTVPPREMLNDIIFKKMDKTKPLTTFANKSQEHGTCSFANIKSLIESFLYDLKLDRLLEMNIAPKIADEMAKKYAREEYKKFTKFIRDYMILKLCSEMKNLNEDDRKLNFDILKETVLTHHSYVALNGDSRTSYLLAKDGNALERARIVLESLNDVEKKEMLNDLLIKNKGSNILESAIYLRNFDMVNFLLKNGLKLSKDQCNVMIKQFINIPWPWIVTQEGVPVNSLKMIKILLENGGDINTLTDNGTLLHNAVRLKDAETLHYLLEHKIKHSLRNKNNETALILALKSKDTSEMAHILLNALGKMKKEPREIILNFSDKEGCTAIKLAARLGDVALTTKLLDLGADPTQGSIFQDSAIHYAVNGRNVEVVKLLISKGVDPDQTADKNVTPLIYAVKNQDIEMVRFLISLEQVDVDKQDYSQSSAIDYALKGKNGEIVKLLREKSKKKLSSAAEVMVQQTFSSDSAPSNDLAPLIFSEKAKLKIGVECLDSGLDLQGIVVKRDAIVCNSVPMT